MRTPFSAPLIMIGLIFFGLLAAPLDGSAASIQERMKARLDSIIALKNQGLIGEDAHGYLAYRTDQRPEQQLVQDENNDRRAVYSQIAKQQGVDAALVGQRRAKQIAEKATPGHWFRRADGSWYRK